MADAPSAPAAPPAAPSAPATPPVVPASSIPAPATPSAPPKPGSAKDRVFSDLQKLASKGPAPAPDPKAKAAPAPTDPPATPEGDDPPAAPADDKGTPPPDPKKKANPWDLYNKSKETVKTLEARLAELESKVMKPEQQKEWEQKTARLKELEEEIRYTNYQKSSEFQEKYQKPYDAAWKRAVGDLGELTVPDGQGGERPMQANDLLELVNLPLQEARKIAVEKFGDFANDAMQHRKEIRRLFDEQAAALDTVRKEGEAREKTRMEQYQQQIKTMTKEVQETWNAANEAAKTDEKYGRYFKPVEGDADWNQRLAKGTELTDRAFSENPTMAKDADERRAIVQRHAAVRNRAAAFGALVHLTTKLEGQVAALNEKLKRYEGAEPPAGGSAPAKEGQKPTSAWGRLQADLEKYATK